MQSPRLTHLRQATASLHEELERQVEAREFFAALPAYRAYIQRMHGFYREFDRGHLKTDHALRDLSPASRRIGWLEDDLAALGVSALGPTPGEATDSAQATPVGRSEFLGSLYVICGAALGARLLVHKTATLGLPEGRGRTYFTNVAAADDWKRYLLVLEQAADIAIGALQAGAITTFRDIRRHLCGSYPQ